MRSLFPRASPTPSASTRERKSPIGCCCTGRPLAYGTRRQSSSLHGSPRCSSRRHRRRRGPPSSRRAASSPIRFRPHVAAACRPATRWKDSSPCGRRSGTASGALSRGLPRSPSVGRGVPSAASRGRGPLRARGTAGRSSPLAPSPSPRRRSRPLGRGTDHRIRFALAAAGRACGCRGSVGGSSSDTSRRPRPPRISGRDGGPSSRRPESRVAHRPRCSSHPLRPGENKTAGAALSLPSGGISKSVAPFSVRWFLVLPERTRGYVAIIVAAVLFGIWPTLSKLVLNAVSPVAIAFLIQVIPGAALLPFVRRVRIHRADWKLIALSGVVGAVIGPLIYFYGLERTTASNSVLLSNSESLFTLLFAYAVPLDVLPALVLLSLSAVGVFSVLFFYAFRTIGAMRTGALLPSSALWGILVALYVFPTETLSPVQVLGGALMIGSLIAFYILRGPTETESGGETLKPAASDGPDSPSRRRPR